MQKFTVEFKKSAKKELAALDSDLQKSITDELKNFQKIRFREEH